MVSEHPIVIEHTLVQHPQFRMIWTKIEEIHSLWRDQNLKKILRLHGVSGVGKTSLLHAYRDTHPRYNVQDRTVIPVLYTDLPAHPTPTSITAQLLNALGDPGFNTGTLNLRLKRLFHLIRECGVELILVDEVHHIMDRGQVRTHTAIADQFKNIIDHSEAAFVLSGAPRMKTLFQVNTQLRGRAMSGITLSPFDILDPSSLVAFKGVLASLALKMQIENFDLLLDDDSVKRFFYATDGVLRNLSNLLGQANRQLTTRRHLTLPVLQEAFHAVLWRPSSEEADPFARNFEFRRLVQCGEPYEPSILDGDNHDPI